MTIIDGKKIAIQILDEIKAKIPKLKRAPLLAVIIVGEDPASLIYVSNKEKRAKDVGINSLLIRLKSSVTETELLSQIQKLNRDPLVDAILVQLPLPKQINESKILETIDPTKDVDGFHPQNVGKLLLGEKDCFVPCTALGIKVLLEMSHIPLKGKEVVILNRSNIVGKPLSMLLIQKGVDATVTIAHSQTPNLKEVTKRADILITATGRAKFITASMVKENSAIIDVGITRVNNKLIGDVDFENVVKKVSYITPVPGGVGPMTIAMLLKNSLLAYIRKYETNLLY